MNIRSTNADGVVHFGGSVIAGVNSSHGVEIRGGSTGGVVAPIGDDANISILLKGQGTGAVNIGDSSQALNLNSSTVQIGSGSTTPVRFVQRYVVQFTEPDLAASSWVDSSYTVAGLTTNCSLHFTPRLILAAGYMVGDVRCSTVAELIIRWVNARGSTISGSTNRGTLIAFQY